MTPAWLTSVVYLDESIRKAFDWDGSGQAGVAQVGGTPMLQLSLTSEQSLQGWESQPHPQPQSETTTPARLFLLCPVLLCTVPVLTLSLRTGIFLLAVKLQQNYHCQWPYAISCFFHWSAHKQGAAIDPLVSLINRLSLWETTEFSLPIRTLW